MIAALMVSTMVATVEELLNVPPSDPLAERRVLDVAERRAAPDRAGRAPVAEARSQRPEEGSR